MDENIKNNIINNFKTSHEFNKKKCNKCKRNLNEEDFIRNNKTFKVCNFCETRRKNKNDLKSNNNIDEIKDIIIKKDLGISNKEIREDVNINDNVNESNNKTLESNEMINKFVDNIQLDKINNLEKTLKMTETSEQEWQMKSNKEKFDYSNFLMKGIAEQFEKSKFNPLSFLYFSMIGTLEKTSENIEVLNEYEINLKGLSQEIYKNKEEIDNIMCEIMQDPIMMPYMSVFLSPFAKLLIVTGSNVVNCVMKNKISKEEGSNK
jgi:hypothetical protein